MYSKTYEKLENLSDEASEVSPPSKIDQHLRQGPTGGDGRRIHHLHAHRQRQNRLLRNTKAVQRFLPAAGSSGEVLAGLLHPTHPIQEGHSTSQSHHRETNRTGSSRAVADSWSTSAERWLASATSTLVRPSSCFSATSHSLWRQYRFAT